MNSNRARQRYESIRRRAIFCDNERVNQCVRDIYAMTGMYEGDPSMVMGAIIACKIEKLLKGAANE